MNYLKILFFKNINDVNYKKIKSQTNDIQINKPIVKKPIKQTDKKSIKQTIKQPSKQLTTN